MTTGNKRIWMVLLAAVVLLSAACTNDGLDDGSSADVILAIETFESPAVTGEAAVAPATGCVFTVEDWQVTFSNEPKNTLATGPFNDIVMNDVTIGYNFISGAVVQQRVVGLGNVSIPASGTASVTFAPISFNDLVVALAGQTANLTLIFRGTTIEGTTITETVNRQLFIEGCS